MERTQIFDLMSKLNLYGMKVAYDEIMATAIKRQHEPQRIVGDLLSAEVNEKQARSIKYQLTIAKLPLAKDIDDFQFEDTPINQTLVKDLAGGGSRGTSMTNESDHRRKVLSARLAEVRVLRDEAQQRIQALTEQDDDEVLGAADLQGVYRRLQHLQDCRDALQDEIVDLEEQLNRFEFLSPAR